MGGGGEGGVGRGGERWCGGGGEGGDLKQAQGP